MTAQLDTPISVGIAGWSYDDWAGYVYHRGIKDKLQFVAGYFDVVEINSSFYRPPSERTVASWAARTQMFPGFHFTAKLHNDVTHRGVLDPNMTTAFLHGFHPLIESGQLHHFLAQFRYDFDDTPSHRVHLQRIREAYGTATQLTLELRHNTWQAPDALAFLRELEVNVANLDYPTARNSFNLRRCDVGNHAYLRLHGRNTKAWFSKAGRNETYNYLYTEEELDDIAARAVELAEASESLTVIANNHYQGKEAVNALQLKSKLTGETLPVPPALREKYPALETISCN